MSSAEATAAGTAGPHYIRIDTATPDDTAALARALAFRLIPGDRLWLEGPIGAGKTHFARALIQARLDRAGLWEDVPSPTFTLVQTYDDGVCEIWHADLYRLTDPADAVELGLDEAFGTAITLVEWPDRLPPEMRAGGIAIAFRASGETGRQITFSFPTEGVRSRLFPDGGADGD